VDFVDPEGEFVCGGLCIARIVTTSVVILHYRRNWFNDDASYEDVQEFPWKYTFRYVYN